MQEQPEQAPHIEAIGRSFDAAVLLPANLPPLAQIALAREMDAIRKIRDDWTSKAAPELTLNFGSLMVGCKFLQISWSQCKADHAAVQAFRVYFVRVLQAFGDACKTVSAILGPIDDSMRVVNTNLDLLRPGFSAALQAAYQDATQVLAQYNFKGDDPSDLDIIRALAGVVGGPTAEAIAAVRASIQRVKDDIQSHLNAVNGLQDAGSYIASAASLLTATMGEVDDIKVASQTAQTAAERGEDLDDALLVMEIDTLFKNQLAQIVKLCAQEIGDAANPNTTS